MIPMTPGLTPRVVLLMVAGFIASLKVAVITVLEHTPAEPLAGLSEITVGGGLHPLAAVLKLHVKSVAKGLPKVSLAPVVMMAV